MTESTLNPTATPFLPAIASLPTLTDTALTSTLDLLFEPSPSLHALALPTIRTLSFTSYPDLIATLRTQLLELASSSSSSAADDPAGGEIQKRLHAILGSHPRLGERKPEGGALSGFSADEQRHLRAEGERLGELNAEYEARFPGLRYVVWVNGRGREEVMADMRRRIERGDLREEERVGIRVGFCLFFLPFFCLFGW
jgi:2-oxo-4-hydroxy-4-carboxy--5-ureidoimidazoline (OHCU) decarboxylase